jgi:predicted TPR repeat methyltransferase
MKTAAEHYDAHLGRVYGWMLGDLDAAYRRAVAELHDMDVPDQPGVAVDLGAGLGLHSVALAELGYRVIAVDGCAQLLEELKRRKGSLPIDIVHGDLCAFRRSLESPCELILLLGDTLTHLSSFSAVDALLQDVAASLNPGGLFAATFRDYASKTLSGDERFILVRRDEDRVLTCFLEYGEDTVAVHDILTERKEQEWVQRVSSYPKLRLRPESVMEKLKSLGLKPRRETAPSGMVRIVARRPQ